MSPDPSASSPPDPSGKRSPLPDTLANPAAHAQAADAREVVAMLLCEPYKSSSYYVGELVRGMTSYLDTVNAQL